MIKVINADNIKVLKKIPDNYFHSIVCDPPYHIGFMGKQWDHVSDKNKKIGIAFDISFWKAVLRVLKPGGYLLAFAAAKLDHRIAVAIEDAGFIIRDKLLWMYGSGFPKGQNIAKAIDKKKGLKGKIIDTVDPRGMYDGKSRKSKAINNNWRAAENRTDSIDNSKKQIVSLVSDEAKRWEGWNTAIKPAYEPIIMAQKPLSEKTIVANVLKWGVGAINIGGCRVGNTKNVPASISKNKTREVYGKYVGETGKEDGHNPNVGRYPANVIHDGSEEVEAAFLQFGIKTTGKLTAANQAKGGFSGTKNAYGKAATGGSLEFEASSGSASRFFYCAKVSTKDRAGSKHPTIKPMSLMQYLVRLVTPPKGKVCDPFLGSGTTAIACELEGFSCVGIEWNKDSYKEYFIRRKHFVKSKQRFYFNLTRK